MICPFCNNKETKVVDSRDTSDGRAVRRRRECEKCGARFSTYEEMEIMKMLVVKRDGTKVEYNQDKLMSGLKKALNKRPVSSEKMNKILSDIEYEMHSEGRNEISSKEIGKMVLGKLKKIDTVAYLRFASVYKSFGSAGSFQKEISKLDK